MHSYIGEHTFMPIYISAIIYPSKSRQLPYAPPEINFKNTEFYLHLLLCLLWYNKQRSSLQHICNRLVFIM